MPCEDKSTLSEIQSQIYLICKASRKGFQNGVTH